MVALDHIITAPLEVLLRDFDQTDSSYKLSLRGQDLFKSALDNCAAGVEAAGKILQLAYVGAVLPV